MCPQHQNVSTAPKCVHSTKMHPQHQNVSTAPKCVHSTKMRPRHQNVSTKENIFPNHRSEPTGVVWKRLAGCPPHRNMVFRPTFDQFTSFIRVISAQLTTQAQWFESQVTSSSPSLLLLLILAQSPFLHHEIGLGQGKRKISLSVEMGDERPPTQNASNPEANAEMGQETIPRPNA